MEHQSQAMEHQSQAMEHQSQAMEHQSQAIIPDSLRLTRCPAKIWCRKCSTENEKRDSSCQTCKNPLHTLQYQANIDISEIIKGLRPFKDV